MSNNYGFLDNMNEDGNIVFPVGAKLIKAQLLLTDEEYSELEKMAKEMDLSTHGVLKQALRVLQMHRAGYLIDNSPKSGSCGADE